MKTSIECTINALGREASAGGKWPNPFSIFLRWFGASVAYVALLTFLLGLRLDIHEKIFFPLYQAELAALALVVITTGLASTWLAFPDLRQQRWIVMVPVVPFFGFCALIAYAYVQDNPPAPPYPFPGIQCLLCILVMSFPPAMWFTYQLRKLASTHYYFTGAMLMLASFSLGALALRLSEDTDSIIHLILWHYLPITGFGAMGIWIGRKWLRW